LPNSDITATVLAEIAALLQPGAIILDTTTSAPEHAEAFAAQLQQYGVSYLEANVGGSSDQVRRHDAIAICGGELNAYEQCSELLDLLFRRKFYVGACGSASRMKLVLNLVLGLNRAVLAEGLSFAIANGLDLAPALEILRAGPAFSRVMDTKGDKMIQADFSAQARLSQHLKDVRLILTQGGRLGAKLPFTELHRQILQALEEAGYGHEDNSVVIRAFQAVSQ
jgi:3-hydroxyisobutyrate dehydrogenase-like beta-hydroxyacid dehydrogenase